MADLPRTGNLHLAILDHAVNWPIVAFTSHHVGNVSHAQAGPDPDPSPIDQSVIGGDVQQHKSIVIDEAEANEPSAINVLVQALGVASVQLAEVAAVRVEGDPVHVNCSLRKICTTTFGSKSGTHL
jgi:hypothetical protein